MLGTNNWHKDLLEKFCSEGINSFDDSEVLKLLLGYTSSFKNIGEEETDQIIDKLLVHIGSVSGVMDVFPEVVSRLTGMDRKSAMLLNMIPELARKYCRGNQKVDNTNGWICDNCGANVTTPFCPVCGTKNLNAEGWDCKCGTKSIMTAYCHNCGMRKEDQL